jgi:hypothetical protein|tara:strand:+ start:759 stop:1055 length:297 start_codon:yes stop_codon:yes gene_type:complete
MPIIDYSNVFQPKDAIGSDLKQQDVSSQINGSNQTFTISEDFSSTQCFVFWNGLYQRIGVEITVASSTTFTTEFVAAGSDTLVVVYKPTKTTYISGGC